MNNGKSWVRLSLGVGVCLAAAGVPGDSVAGNGTVTLWLDDSTNTIGAMSFCETVSNDQNGDGNGNAGTSTVTNDQNGDGNGNNGASGAGRQICLFGVGGSSGTSGGTTSGGTTSGGDTSGGTTSGGTTSGGTTSGGTTSGGTTSGGTTSGGGSSGGVSGGSSGGKKK